MRVGGGGTRGAELATARPMAKPTKKKDTKNKSGADLVDQIARFADAAVSAAKTTIGTRVKSVKKAASRMLRPPV